MDMKSPLESKYCCLEKTLKNEIALTKREEKIGQQKCEILTSNLWLRLR